MKPVEHKLLAAIATSLTGMTVLLVAAASVAWFFSGDEIKSLFPRKVTAEKPGRSHRSNATDSSRAVDYFAPSRFRLDRLPGDAEGAAIRYGYALVNQTYRYVGPAVKKVSMRYAGNYLSCGSCHLQAGQARFASPFVGIWGLYPAYEGRENAISTLADRVNGCMERSMAGRALPLDGNEMKAILLYIKWLSRDVPVGTKLTGLGFVPLSPPDRAASIGGGKKIYAQRCAACHGPDGTGKRNGAAGSASGYAYPPLGGPDTYNDGAGMHRLLTAARFIKANMPLGATPEQPLLNDQEAYDVAAYINSLPRPVKAHKERDYPDLAKKPVDCPYPPYADSFPTQQHRLGPFGPMEKAPAH